MALGTATPATAMHARPTVVARPQPRAPVPRVSRASDAQRPGWSGVASRVAAASAVGRSGAASFYPAQPQPQAPTYGRSDDTSALIARLGVAAAGTARGRIGSNEARAEVVTAVLELERIGREKGVDVAKLNGTWELVYSSVEAFRSSPFFWAFQEGLLAGNVNLASAIFAYTDSVPGATIGSARQTIDTSFGTLVSEVDLTVTPLPGLPGASGAVVTGCDIDASSGDGRLVVTVTDTRVSGSNVAGQLLDQLSVPVKDIFEALRGSGAARTEVTTTYLDDTLRVMRVLPNKELFVYRRV